MSSYGGLLDTQSQQSFQNTEKNTIEEEHNSVLNDFLAQMLSLIELNNPPIIEKAITRTIDYLELSNRILPDFYQGKTLSNIFESLNGIST